MKKLVIGFIILASLGVQTMANIFNGKDEITLVGDRMEVDSTKVYDILLHNAPEDFQNQMSPQ